MSAETQLMWPDEENIFNPDHLLLILSFYQKRGISYAWPYPDIAMLRNRL